MKYLNISVAALSIAFFTGAVNAQVTTTTQAGAAAQSNLNNTSVSIAEGGSSAPGIANLDLSVSPSTVIQSTGSDLSQSVPLVTAPQMTVLGGEDSCLKSRSGGGAISGFGASFGTMVMDNECNRRVLSKLLMAYKQPTLAVAVLCGSPQMWAAAERTAVRTGGSSICFNEKPSSADKISVKLREDVAAGPIDTADDYKWSYPERDIYGNVAPAVAEEDDFIW